MTDSIDLMIEILSIACGIYCLYAYVDMKKTGRINTTILLGKSVNPKKCKNKQEYLSQVIPKVLFLGITLIAYGAIDMFNAFVLKNKIVTLTSIGFFTLILIWFGYQVSQATKKYF